MGSRKEVAVRLAVGVSRGSLVWRLLLTEATLLRLLAACARELSVWLLGLLATGDIPAANFRWRSIASRRPRPRGHARRLGRGRRRWGWCRRCRAPGRTSPACFGPRAPGGGQPEQSRWRNALVVAQLTISPALPVGAGLVLRSVQQVQSVDPGFGHATAALLTFLTRANRFTPDEASVYT